jgi:hypothetical protein
MAETEGSTGGDTTSTPPVTTLPPTTLDSSGTTVGIDTSTTSDDTSGTSSGTSSDTGSSSSGDTTTGGVVCEEPLEPDEDIGSAVGRAVATGTNLGAGDRLEDLCGLRVFGGSESDSDFSDTGIFTTGISDTGIITTGIFTTGFSDTGLITSGFSDTDGLTGTTGGFSDTGFSDSGGEAPTYEEYLIRWTAPAAGSYRFDLSGSDYDTVMGITDACGINELGCNDDCTTLQSQLTLDLAADEVIMIIIGGYAGSTGNFVLSIEEGVPSECEL